MAFVLGTVLTAAGCTHHADQSAATIDTPNPSQSSERASPYSTPIPDQYPDVIDDMPAITESGETEGTWTLKHRKGSALRFFVECDVGRLKVNVADNFFEADCAASDGFSASVPLRRQDETIKITVRLNGGTRYRLSAFWSSA